VLDQPLREVVVRALPDSLPDHIEIDVEELTIGSSVTVADIVASTGVTIVTDPETLVASVVAPSAIVVEEEEEEEVEAAELEGELEGEAPGGDSSDE
jgi:large subunit ribosomal protein L25